MATNANDNAVLYTPVRITNPEDITGGGGGGSSTITAPLGSKVSAQAVSVVVASDQSAVPVSAASLPLPTGAATAAKQPALGTAGSASADVLSVQGIASMTALKVDGSAVTQPVSAASLPLPSGAATAAKQPALGTAGSASADVVTVQGVASMKELLVQLIAGTAAIGKLAANTAGVFIGEILVSASTGATTNVAASASSVTVLAGNSSRKGATIVNDSTSVLYLRMTTAGSAASSTSYSYYLPGTNASGVPSTLEVPYRCTDTITGIWVSATGNARVTEFT
jgi:hypothetical protein